MPWWLHNPIADLPGPAFLALYGAAIAAAIAGVVAAIRRADPTSAFDPPEVPAHPDPYEVAYLRGGANEVIRTAVFSLVQQGSLEVVEEGADRRGRRTYQIRRTGAPPAWRPHPVEARIF